MAFGGRGGESSVVGTEEKLEEVKKNAKKTKGKNSRNSNAEVREERREEGREEGRERREKEEEKSFQDSRSFFFLLFHSFFFSFFFLLLLLFKFRSNTCFIPAWTPTWAPPRASKQQRACAPVRQSLLRPARDPASGRGVTRFWGGREKNCFRRFSHLPLVSHSSPHISRSFPPHLFLNDAYNRARSIGKGQEAREELFGATMSGAGPSATTTMGGNDGDGGGLDRGANIEPLDRLASDGSKYFKTQQQKDALEEAYASAFLTRFQRAEREKEKERNSVFDAPSLSSMEHRS